MCGDSIRLGDGFMPRAGRGDAGNRCAACHDEKRDRQGLCVSRVRQTAGSLHQTVFARRMIGINPPMSIRSVFARCRRYALRPARPTSARRELVNLGAASKPRAASRQPGSS